MIEVKELQPGNLVLRWGTPTKICGTRDLDHTAEVLFWNGNTVDRFGCQEINPIPLTEKILIGCGFRDITDGYRATGAPNGCYRIQLPANGKDFDLYEEREFGKEFSVRLPHYWTEIKYVHQLQNLYFVLTGEELKITL